MIFSMSSWIFVLSLAAPAGAAEKPILPADVPAAVQSSVQARYPGYTLVEASTEREDGRDLVELHLVLGERKVSAEFASDGTFLEEEEPAELGSLPEAVKGALLSRFSGWTLIHATRATEGTKVTFEVVATRRGSCMEFSFDQDGVLLGKDRVEAGDQEG
jgi:hypothetical protein